MLQKKIVHKEKFLYKKNNFAEIFKNLARYKAVNESKLHWTIKIIT